MKVIAMKWIHLHLEHDLLGFLTGAQLTSYKCLISMVM